MYRRIKKSIRALALRVIYAPRSEVKIEIVQANYCKILHNKKIIVTGGSRGIGYAIAKKFLSEGAEVLIIGRNQKSLEDTCKPYGNRMKYLVKDLSKTDDFDSLLKDCEQTIGYDIDGLVLNAGISLHEGNFLHVTKDGFDNQISTNLRANFFFAQTFIKKMLEENKKGDLLFVSSETAGKYNDLPYGLSKVALNSLVGGLARRVYQRGIRVNAIAPGVTCTDMKLNSGGGIIEDYSNSSAAGRFLLPDEIAEVACFLMSKLSTCITGEIMYCDAGSHLKINGKESEYSL